jgi:DNA polymerase III epsilon subunit-like protein
MRVWADVETGGLDPARDPILEVACAAESGAEFQELANPGAEAVERLRGSRALEVNGIDPDELLAARPAVEVARAFKEWLNGLGPVELWAYNAPFDRGFLAKEPWAISELCWGGCVMRLVSRGRWKKLTEVAARMGLAWDGRAHRALADARMAMRVHLEMNRQLMGRMA